MAPRKGSLSIRALARLMPVPASMINVGASSAVRQRQARGMAPVAEELATRGRCRTPGPHDVDAHRAILAAVRVARAGTDMRAGPELPSLARAQRQQGAGAQGRAGTTLTLPEPAVRSMMWCDAEFVGAPPSGVPWGTLVPGASTAVGDVGRYRHR